SGIVYPSNPLSAKPHNDLSSLIVEANVYVREHFGGEAIMSTLCPPFFISSTVLGFFIDPSSNPLFPRLDPTKVLVMDLTSGSVRIQETKSSSYFPLSDANTRLDGQISRWHQASYREVSLIARFRPSSRCWRVGVAFLLNGLFRSGFMFNLWDLIFDLCRLYRFCSNACGRMRDLELQLMEPKTDEFTGFGTFNSRTLEWNEIKASVWNEDETRLISLRSGDFVVTSLTDQISPSRVIGLEYLADKKMERFRLIGNPLRIPSLARLSSIAVQKTDRETSELLEQIAARMIVT
ncbi:hypothetical protein PENTCL1PPCAC_7800, partial [Pristionchus entomophagus]